MTINASVIIPTYNRVSLTRRAINSVLNQSYKNFELIVIDDGSTEDYSEIKNFVDQAKHTFISIPHQGVSGARNSGLNQAKGEFIFFLDSDDEWLPNKLEKQSDHFLAKPNSILVQNLERWFRKGREVQVPKHLTPASGDAFVRSLNLCCVSDSSVGFRRELFNKVGFFKPGLRVCEDYDYWLRALCHYKIDLIPEILVVKHSGLHPQLSNSEQALDRFRVYSLWDLLCKDFLKESELNSNNRLELKKTLKTKLDILSAGAQKRGLNEEELVYQKALNILNMSYNSMTEFLLLEVLEGLELVLGFKGKNCFAP